MDIKEFIKISEGRHPDKGKDVEGDGILTYGYGHKNYRNIDFSNYTESQYDSLLNVDIEDASNRARQQFTNMFTSNDKGKNYSTNYSLYDNLPEDAKNILTDISFNVGNIREFKELGKALIKGDWDKIDKDSLYVRPQVGSRNTRLRESYIAPNLSATDNNAFDAMLDSTSSTPALDAIKLELTK